MSGSSCYLLNLPSELLREILEYTIRPWDIIIAKRNERGFSRSEEIRNATRILGCTANHLLLVCKQLQTDVDATIRKSFTGKLVLQHGQNFIFQWSPAFRKLLASQWPSRITVVEDRCTFRRLESLSDALNMHSTKYHQLSSLKNIKLIKYTHIGVISVGPNTRLPLGFRLLSSLFRLLSGDADESFLKMFIAFTSCECQFGPFKRLEVFQYDVPRHTKIQWEMPISIPSFWPAEWKTYRHMMPGDLLLLCVEASRQDVEQVDSKTWKTRNVIVDVGNITGWKIVSKSFARSLYYDEGEVKVYGANQTRRRNSDEPIGRMFTGAELLRLREIARQFKDFKGVDWESITLYRTLPLPQLLGDLRPNYRRMREKHLPRMFLVDANERWTRFRETTL